MSQLVRRIQKGRQGYGSRLGITNENSADRVARLAREEKRNG